MDILQPHGTAGAVKLTQQRGGLVGGGVAHQLHVKIIFKRHMRHGPALDGLHIEAAGTDDLDHLAQLAGFVVHREQQREPVAAGRLFAAEHDKAGGVVAVGVDAGHQHLQPVQCRCLHACNGRFGGVAAFGHELCGHGGVGHGGGGQAELP